MRNDVIDHGRGRESVLALTFHAERMLTQEQHARLAPALIVAAFARAAAKTISGKCRMFLTVNVAST